MYVESHILKDSLNRLYLAIFSFFCSRANAKLPPFLATPTCTKAALGMRLGMTTIYGMHGDWIFQNNCRHMYQQIRTQNYTHSNG